MTDHEGVTVLTRGQLASATGCDIETIRYYEKIAMLPDPPRTASGYRLYDDHHVTRLRFILRARELGFSIHDIRGLLELVEGGSQTCAEVKDRTERHLADIRAKLADLEKMRQVLETAAAKCSGDNVPECPIIETLTSA